MLVQQLLATGVAYLILQGILLVLLAVPQKTTRLDSSLECHWFSRCLKANGSQKYWNSILGGLEERGTSESWLLGILYSNSQHEQPCTAR